MYIPTKMVKINTTTVSYEIHIGHNINRQAGELLRSKLVNNLETVIVSNPTIWKYFGEQLENSLKDAGIQTYVFLIKEGEENKNLRTAEKLWSYLIEKKIEKRTTLIAFGGGAVGDLTGFVASTYLRGIPYVYIPTTLLAQIDSSIGGKTAVNHPRGKNLIGTFYHPILVLIDIEFLLTLPRREWNSAWYEAIKYGMISNEELFDTLENQLPFSHRSRSLWSINEISFLLNIIPQCCRIKGSIVEEDEKEKDKRRILNFGHTVGHALEAATNYKKFRHGEAVCYGMIAAFQISLCLGFCNTEDYTRFISLVRKVGKLPNLNGINFSLILDAIHQDKKRIGNNIQFILPRRIGEVFEHSVPSSLISVSLEEVFKF